MGSNKLAKLFIVMLVCVIFAGCANSSTTKSASTSGSSSNAGQPSQAKLTSITMSEPVRVLSFSPVYVAVEKGFFKDEGLDVKIVSGGGGNQVMATLISGQAQLGIAAPNAAFKTMSAGKDVEVVQSLNSSLTFEIALSEAYMKKKGLDSSKKLSIKEKVEALKGATLATDTIGDSGDIFLRYLMELYGQKTDDIKVVKVTGLGAKIAGMKEGVVDGGINSTPFSLEAANKGAGKLWISSSEVPEYSKMAWEVIYGLKDYMKGNHDLVVKAVRAIGKGIEYTREHPKEAAALIQPSYFNGTELATIEQGLASLKNTFNGHGEMDKESWDNAQKPLVKYSSLTGIEKALDTSPDTFWTNSYIKEAFK